MKNKIIIITLIVLGIMLAILAGFYFVRQNKSSVNSPENTTQQVSAGSQEKIDIGAGLNNQTNNEQLQNKLVTDDFEITFPVGWRKTEPVMGVSVMAVNTNEQLSDPAAQRINFKSYAAVSYDTLQGKSLGEYLQSVKSQLSQTISNVVFTNEQDIIINNRSARAIEAELTQQGVNYKILMIVVAGQGDDVWVMSFNTIKSSWDGYKEIFSNIAKSFSLKK
ncbi:hypothetical protein KKA33_01525 [Patescibacteria group bacterium]|nr:hypothetical protein [Patescibacteria group bacterium]